MNNLKHLAVICDGNGRWAEKRGYLRSTGHHAGLDKLEELTRWCKDLSIPVLSAYVFSLDNWKRPKDEVDALFNMADTYFDRWPEFVENDVRVVISGVKDNLREETIEKMARIQRETKHCKTLTLNLCANYSGRREISDAVMRGAKTPEEITKALYNELPPPDLILRTGGHSRLSDFLLWQAAYAELAFTDTLFPDLSLGELKFHIKRFAATDRKYGGLSNA